MKEFYKEVDILFKLSRAVDKSFGFYNVMTFIYGTFVMFSSIYTMAAGCITRELCIISTSLALITVALLCLARAWTTSSVSNKLIKTGVYISILIENMYIYRSVNNHGFTQVFIHEHLREHRYEEDKDMPIGLIIEMFTRLNTYSSI